MRIIQSLLLGGTFMLSMAAVADENPAQLDTSVPAAEGTVIGNQGIVVKSNDEKDSKINTEGKSKAAQ